MDIECLFGLRPFVCRIVEQCRIVAECRRVSQVVDKYIALKPFNPMLIEKRQTCNKRVLTTHPIYIYALLIISFNSQNI